MTVALSPRERDVLTAIANGKCSKQIALDLGIAYRTVLNDREKIAEKTHSANVNELVLFAVQVDMGLRTVRVTS